MLISTREVPGGREWTFQEALFLGQAPDGGLFVPAALLPLPDGARAVLPTLTFAERAFVAARHFLGDEIRDDLLRAVVHDALNFPVPLREIEPGIHMLELFHGPTHAFKDVGARFMARMMSALRDDDSPPVTILTATSGDTGGAVAHAFHRLPGVHVGVLYPLGKVSHRQEAQFAALGGNVTAVAVRGTFDDCQRLARQAFADPALTAALSLTSANSINIGRLLPQTFYYIHALTELAQESPDSELVVSVPSGNFGNLTAGLIARRALGMSLARFVAATNENSVVPEYLAGHGFHPRPSVETISSAMDVGDPSNFRRILHLFGGDGGRPGDSARYGPQSGTLHSILTGSSWTDSHTPPLHPRPVAASRARGRPAHGSWTTRSAPRDEAVARCTRHCPGNRPPREVRGDGRAADRGDAADPARDCAGNGPACEVDRDCGGTGRIARGSDPWVGARNSSRIREK
ncbi:MAG: threonine synthase [Gemmatimonadetes bacterium]|nr:threonine synthase [Gemmatimonadota bacterium]MYG23858.1 threonine synthase [Gemmatimonadota bacterium]MYJ37506.1 threonine synthase [Gemmatimonadota bacterium]